MNLSNGRFWSSEWLMIENDILVQAFTTVLAGILIIATLERHFIGKELFSKKADKLRKKTGRVD